jgi:hypothetical protein
MKRATLLAALAALFCWSAPMLAWGGGMAHDENGVVYAPDVTLAQAVLQKAGEYRREVALEWLGEELPPSVGRVRIHVHLSDADSGQTWANDSPGRHYHTIWLHGNEQSLTGGLLKHEITHAVLATQFPEGLPPVIDEGIASTADDPKRKAIRSRILDWYARSGNWPRLATLLESRLIAADDQQSYAIASSVVEYLLTRGDKPTLLRFARSGKANGWDQALRMHYQIGGVTQLESQWQAWASEQTSAAQTASNQVAGKATLR